MTLRAVLLILRRLACEAGVEEFSPHDLRQSFVSYLLDAGSHWSRNNRIRIRSLWHYFVVLFNSKLS